MAAPEVTSEVLPHNGAGILWVPAVRKFGVYDVWTCLHGYRTAIEAARELAASLPGHPVEPAAEPVPIPRAPGALPVEPATYLPAGVARDERRDWEPPRARRQQPWADAYWQRRLGAQREAHDRVYGRHHGEQR